MCRIRIAAAIAVQLSLSTIAAQVPAELDAKYTPNEASPFSEAASRGVRDEGEMSFAIRYCPTALLRQKILFYGETRIGSRFTLNLGVGKAFGRDVFQNEAISWKYAGTFDTGADFVIENSKFSGSGLLISGGLRVYVYGKAMNGYYLEANFRRETMKYSLDPDRLEQPVLGSTTSEFIMSNVNFGFGFTSADSRRGLKFQHDFFFLVGSKHFAYNSFDLINPTGSMFDLYYTKSGTKYETIFPAVHIGYSFGFGM